MFDWLYQSVFMAHTATKKSVPSIKPDFNFSQVMDIFQLDNLYTKSYPFMTCPQTIDHYRKSKVMFLMRGLPGSGKSTLVDILKRIYSHSCQVCSADHFFMSEETGEYKFDRSKISDAHQTCQRNAEDACRAGINAIVIDNTNIRMDESHNIHQVPLDTIQARLHQYRPFIPFFFGLFVNHEQSTTIIEQAYDYYHQALQTFPMLKKDLERISREKNVSVNSLLNRSNMIGTPKLLHCTVKFIGKPTDQSRRQYTDYAGNVRVSHLLGKLCSAYIVSFIITPRTLGARLIFPERHTWSIWDMNDDEAFDKNNGSQGDQKGCEMCSSLMVRSFTEDEEQQVDIIDVEENFEEHERGLQSTSAISDKPLCQRCSIRYEQARYHQSTILHPTCGFMSRAHFTVGVAPGSSAVQTGQDLLSIIQKESDLQKSCVALCDNKLNQTVMKYMGNGECAVYLKEPILVQTIFSGAFH
ncbi:unnamed protein product [Didymodactylos carnosus]|uniref:2',3'-cyclic-nucleotide 3'-phosphodiesterase n=1 Tax=Didymodactylos carnosus TaxID=1234261 RepID=A0A8S2CW70_9BILA|nr:unnamed protein product [Didymodactylos carnosus]CAF3519668.1 unnamed protein product [Didymodactylos carnosus]